MTKILAILVTLGLMACATDIPTNVDTQGLCTADDPGCGPPGSNPAAIQRTSSYYSTQADDGSERIGCYFQYPNEWSCSATFTIFGAAYGGYCTFFTRYDDSCGCNVITTWSCTPAVSR